MPSGRLNRKYWKKGESVMNKKKALFLGVLCIVLIIVACFFALNRKDKVNETSA